MAPLPALGWDQDQRRIAWDEYHRLAERDPDAAAVLRIQLEAEATQAAQQQQPPPDTTTDMTAGIGVEAQVLAARSGQRSNRYDPMKLYHAYRRAYPSATHAECEALHFVTFFAYLREATLTAEREQRELEEARQGHNSSASASAGAVHDPELASLMAMARGGSAGSGRQAPPLWTSAR